MKQTQSRNRKKTLTQKKKVVNEGWLYKDETADQAVTRNLRALLLIIVFAIAFVRMLHIYTGKLITIDTDHNALAIININNESAKLTDEQLLIAKCVCSEAIGEIYDGKVGVANVIYNRHVNRKQSINDVIYEPGQFDGIKNKYFKRSPTYDCKKAVKQIFIDSNFILPLSVEYFHNKEKSTDKKHVDSVEQYIYTIIGNHTFCHNKNLINKNESI